MNIQDATSLAAFIVSNKKSVLFLDTCAILDIVRFVNRSQAAEIAAANELLGKINVDPALCQIVISSVIPKEYYDNLDSPKKELEKYNENLSVSVEQYNIANKIFNNSFKEVILGSSNLDYNIQYLADQFIDKSIIVKDEDRFHAAASRRVVLSKPPASKGKQELKDCIIVEEYLEVCKLIQNAKLNLPLFFLSSNYKDFCIAETKEIKEELAKEFNQYGLEYCYSWSHVLKMLKTI